MIKEDLEWADVPGYPKYQVSVNGQIKAIASGRILSPYKVGEYSCIKHYFKGKIKTLLVHRAVALAFIPNPENKPHVNHIDANPSNNRIENLEWCTAKENFNHSRKLGRDWYSKGGVRSGGNRKSPITVINISTGAEEHHPTIKSFCIASGNPYSSVCRALGFGNIFKKTYKIVHQTGEV